ncbi:hypothetical protein LCGC14_0663280 [marine sediment metagenome]|uniref:Uncharacterized protein n=1 Tax=marine sediment metagenome TaxID=412755 RepID=A0A0F9QT18_9ZZZZ
MNVFKVGFWHGVVVALACYSLIQDCMGLEVYIAHLRANWVDERVGVPLSVAALVVVAVLRLKGWPKARNE